MFEAKQETFRILLRAKKRDDMVAALLESLPSTTPDDAKRDYNSVLKLSCKLFNQIERLRVDNALLNRPFMYNGENLQLNLVRDQLLLRDNVLKHFKKELKHEVDRVLDKQGRVIKVSTLAAQNKGSTGTYSNADLESVKEKHSANKSSRALLD